MKKGNSRALLKTRVQMRNSLEETYWEIEVCDSSSSQDFLSPHVLVRSRVFYRDLCGTVDTLSLSDLYGTLQDHQSTAAGLVYTVAFCRFCSVSAFPFLIQFLLATYLCSMPPNSKSGTISIKDGCLDLTLQRWCIGRLMLLVKQSEYPWRPYARLKGDVGI